MILFNDRRRGAANRSAAPPHAQSLTTVRAAWKSPPFQNQYPRIVPRFSLSRPRGNIPRAGKYFHEVPGRRIPKRDGVGESSLLERKKKIAPLARTFRVPTRIFEPLVVTRLSGRIRAIRF